MSTHDVRHRGARSVLARPIVTADDFGMSRWWDVPDETGAPQTARSEGDGTRPINLLDHADLDSLDDARLHYARRMAADAVDHLIALMDAIDARTEDLEAVNEDGDTLDVGEGDLLEDAEDDDPGEESDHGEEDGSMEPSLAALESQGDQTSWARGGMCDGEVEAEDNATAPESHGMGFVRCKSDDLEDGADLEEDYRSPWVDGPPPELIGGPAHV